MDIISTHESDFAYRRLLLAGCRADIERGLLPKADEARASTMMQEVCEIAKDSMAGIALYFSRCASLYTICFVRPPNIEISTLLHESGYEPSESALNWTKSICTSKSYTEKIHVIEFFNRICDSYHTQYVAV